VVVVLLSELDKLEIGLLIKAPKQISPRKLELTLSSNITIFKLEVMYGDTTMALAMETGIIMDIQKILKIRRSTRFDHLSLQFRFIYLQ
jgi:hypothetical protein